MSIKTLFAQRDQLASRSRSEVSAIEERIQEALNAIYADTQWIDDAIKALCSSNDFTWNEFGEIDQWLRVEELSDVPAEEREFLETYLQDGHCIQIDWSNDVIQSSVGPSIVINEEGDILDQDSGKWIIARKEYQSEEERNALIEAYMEKTGYFPGVYRSDRHGNVYPVNTQAKGGES